MNADHLRFWLLLVLVVTVAFILGAAIRAGWDSLTSVPEASASEPTRWTAEPPEVFRPLPAVATPDTRLQPTTSPPLVVSTPVPKPREIGRRFAAGWATWYDDGPGLYAAAGPSLRKAIGPHWRDRIVTVCSRVCVDGVRLSDWCACGQRHGRPTVLDLSLYTFARIGVPSRGVIEVIVSW